MRNLTAALLLLAWAGLAPACTPSSSTGPDVVGDITSETLPDTVTEADPDAVPDSVLDTGPDSVAEPVPDRELAQDVLEPHEVPVHSDVPPPDITIGKQPIAGVCSQDDDCQDGLCATVYFGGYCTRTCAKEFPCPDGATCLKSPETGEKMCWKLCASADDCRADQLCAGTGTRVCVARCQAGGCKNGLTCNLDTGVCESAPHVCTPTAESCDGADNDCNGITDEGCGPSPTLGGGVEWVDLGWVRAGGGGGGLSYERPLSLPADTLSFTLIALEETPDLAMFWTLRAPDGTPLIKGSDIFASVNRTYPQEGYAAVLVPNNPAVTAQGGTYAWSVLRQADDVANLRVGALLKRGAAPWAGSFSLNLHFAGLSWMNAATAQQDDGFQLMVQYLRSVYQQAGISLGDIGYFDVPNGGQYASLSVSDDPAQDERQALLKTSAQHAGSPAINVYFVSDIVLVGEGSGYYDALGIAGGIPGPLLFQGTFGSGVVVDLSDFQWGWYSREELASMYAEVVGHEVGHQLGLYHTSESSGEMHDQLTDTAECQDQDGDGMAGSWECYGAADNLMFWEAAGSLKLSEQQKWVLLRTPAVW
jgi:hypothetical protein